MPDIGISKERQDSRHGRYVARIAGVEGEGEITFTDREPHLISADHTGAPETMRGTGAAAALVGYMIEDARKLGFRIIPICPYVRAQYRKHPEWADVMTVAPGEDPQV
ncbi:MAG: N-acetyltransferase [Rhizobiales bacterium]|nr:N-acetyltransferase [Hyphomicrobiales bacterium]